MTKWNEIEMKHGQTVNSSECVCKCSFDHSLTLCYCPSIKCTTEKGERTGWAKCTPYTGRIVHGVYAMVNCECGVCMKAFCYSFERTKERIQQKNGRKESNCIGIKCQTFHNLLDPIKQMYGHWNILEHWIRIGIIWICAFLLADFLLKSKDHVHNQSMVDDLCLAKFSLFSLELLLVLFFYSHSISGDERRRKAGNYSVQI